MRGIVVLLLSVQNSRHLIDVALKRRAYVDGVGAGSGGGEGGLGLGEISEAVVDLGFGQVAFDEEGLVVELLELHQEPGDELKGLGVLLLLVVNVGELRLNSLPEECPVHCGAPLDDGGADALQHVELPGGFQAHDVEDWGGERTSEAS